MRTLQTLVLCGAVALCPAAVAAQAPTPPKQAEHQPATRTLPAAMPNADEAEYAARELVAPDLEQFEGGASLSITLGTTALIVVAVLIALLIIF